MGLKEDVLAEMNGRTGPRCGLCLWLDGLDPAVAAEWDEVLADKGSYTHAAVHRIVVGDKWKAHNVGRSAVEDHRNNRHRIVT